MECRGNHVRGQPRAELLAHYGRIERLFPNVEGHELLIAHDHGAVAHARQAHERALDLADLDPKAADLDLGIAAAEELELPIGQPAAVVTAPIQAPTWAVGIGEEGAARALGVIDVPAADAHAGKDDLTGF